MDFGSIILLAIVIVVMLALGGVIHVLSEDDEYKAGRKQLVERLPLKNTSLRD